MNPAILLRHRAKGGTYINSADHFSDISTTMAVEELEREGYPIKSEWGRLSPELYDKLCGRQMKIRQELSSGKAGHELRREFESDQTRDIYTLEDGNSNEETG